MIGILKTDTHEDIKFTLIYDQKISEAFMEESLHAVMQSLGSHSMVAVGTIFYHILFYLVAVKMSVKLNARPEHKQLLTERSCSNSFTYLFLPKSYVSVVRHDCRCLFTEV